MKTKKVIHNEDCLDPHTCWSDCQTNPGKPQPTPTPPWKVRKADAVSPDVIAITSNGITVALVPIEGIHDENANAAFIVKAVNCHEELVGLLIHCREYLGGYAEKPDMAVLAKAIAKAEEK